MTIRLLAAVLCLGVSLAAQSPAVRDLRRTALTLPAPSGEIVRLDIDGDGLTEMGMLANAASVAERHANAYWIKEKAFREIRARLKEARQSAPARAAAFDALEKDLARLYYLGKFDEYVARIADVPGR